MSALQEQYRRFPYPPIPWLALPAPSEGRALCYDEFAPHDGIRIAVVGCGTLEPLIVAQAHPRAREVVAIDFSESSLTLLSRRIRLARAARAFGLRPASAPIRLVCGDIESSDLIAAPYDYILASNVLHHLEEPARALVRLARALRPGGLLRMVTYPRASRIWMRRVARRFREAGLTPQTPELLKACRALIASLPSSHPERECFLLHPEIQRQAGLIDAFFNARENPLSPLEWKRAAEHAGLELAREPEAAAATGTQSLDAWERLEVIDRHLQLHSNPVFWLRLVREPGKESEAPRREEGPENLEHAEDETRAHAEIAQALTPS